MDKTKSKFNKKYCIMFLLCGLFFVASIVLFIFSVFPLYVFLVLLPLNLIAFTILFVIYMKNRKKVIQKINFKEGQITITDKDIIDLFNKAGIPIVKDQDGKIKNIFELLGIEPIFDNDGNRISTIYEQLSIVPRFYKNGKEKPTVLSIKNRAKKFLKTEKTGVLTRKLSDSEKEEILIREMLRKKMEEAVAVGDKKKVNAIKNVINQKQKEKEDKPQTPAKIVFGKDAKPIATPKYKEIKIKEDKKDFLKNLFVVMDGNVGGAKSPNVSKNNDKGESSKKDDIKIISIPGGERPKIKIPEIKKSPKEKLEIKLPGGINIEESKIKKENKKPINSVKESNNDKIVLPSIITKDKQKDYIGETPKRNIDDSLKKENKSKSEKLEFDLTEQEDLMGFDSEEMQLGM